MSFFLIFLQEVVKERGREMRDVEKLIVKLSFFIKFKVKEENKRKEKKKKKVFDNESSENDGKCIFSQIDCFVLFYQKFIYQ